MNPKSLFNISVMRQYLNREYFGHFLELLKTNGPRDTLKRLSVFVGQVMDEKHALLDFRPIDENTVVFRYCETPKSTMVLFGNCPDIISVLRSIETDFGNDRTEVLLLRDRHDRSVTDCVKGVKEIVATGVSERMEKAVSESRGEIIVFMNAENGLEPGLFPAIKTRIDTDFGVVSLIDANGRESKLDATPKTSEIDSIVHCVAIVRRCDMTS